jgi:hypothetical protein
MADNPPDLQQSLSLIMLAVPSLPAESFIFFFLSLSLFLFFRFLVGLWG